MSYRVRLTLEAKQQVKAISNYIAQGSPQYATRWRRNIRGRLRSLSSLPERLEIAYLARDVGRDIRRTFYGAYQILYTIDHDVVVVLTVRHGARRPLTLDEVRQLD